MAMVKFISYQLTLDLRSRVLRNNLPNSECIFPTDRIDGAFHLGYDLNGKIITVASFFPKKYKNLEGLGYQLRGMATEPLHAGQGYGKDLVNFAINHLKNLGVNYIWCNARTSAVKFYEKIGFEIVSDEFEIAGVGPHYEMTLKLI